MIGFAGLGVFIVSLIFVTVFVLIVGALNYNDPMIGFKGGCIGGLIVILILLLAYLSWTGVSFKQNPEMYGYTRIEQEVDCE